MGTILRTAFALPAVAPTACCTSTRATADPWDGISPADSIRLGEGSSIEESCDGTQTAHVRVEGGHHFLNARDLGPHDGTEPVRFLADGTLTVSGEVRGRIELAGE